MKSLRALCWVAAISGPSVLLPQQQAAPPAKQPVTFSDIAGIVHSECERCHSWDGLGSKAGYVVGTYGGLMDGAFQDGALQRTIIPGDAEHSPLVQYIEGRRQPRMPLDREPLPKDAIQRIRQWIDDGAKSDARTSTEHVIYMDGVAIDKERPSFWLSCRAPKNGQDIGLRVKVIDEATGKIVAYDWPQSSKDRNGRWNQWKIEIPVDAMTMPGRVSVALYVSNGWPVLRRGAEQDAKELDGVIFLLEPKQTPDSELAKQKDFRTAPLPETPPHQSVRFQYVLKAPSNVVLQVKPEGGGPSLFEWADRDLPARKVLETPWNLDSQAGLKTGWYFARLRCESRDPAVFQPDMAILFRVVR